MTTVMQTASKTDSQLAFIAGLQGDHYQYHIRQFVQWVQSHGRDLDRQTIIDYFQDLNASTYAAGTKRIKRQALKKRLRQVARMGGLGTDLSANLETFLHDLDRETITKAPKVNTVHVGKERYLSKDETMRVIHACRTPRQALFIKFLWATGCRVSEMCGVRVGDCKALGDMVHIRVTGKGNKERYVKVSTELYTQIRRCITGEQYLFETANGKPYHRNYVSNQIATITQRAIGRRLRAHTLRHSFATHKIRAGVPIGYVSRYLGHSSLSITSDLYDHGEIDSADLIGDEL